VSVRRREYRARIATRGALDVEGNVEFLLYLGADGTVDSTGRLWTPPSVSGSIAHPLRGETTIRPFLVEGVDVDGALIAAFSADARWTALGRLVDVQYRDLPSGEWVSYGTGRCSGLDELDGPGKFRVQVADESWVARRSTVFSTAGTASIWPCGVRRTWRGFFQAQKARGGRTATAGELFRITLTAGYTAPPIDVGFGILVDRRGRELIRPVVEWFERDLVPAPDRNFGTSPPPGGNFRFTKLRFPNSADVVTDWDIHSFGVDPSVPEDALETLEDPAIAGSADPEDVQREVTITVWVRGFGIPFAPPADEGLGLFVAPEAPPSALNPLHVALADGDNYWGTPGVDNAQPSTGWGWIHVADLTRRVWDQMAVRYDPDNLDAIEADTSFPLLAPRVTEFPADPERWMAANIWGQLMLLAVKDGRGRRKLADLRPPPDDTDLTYFPRLDASNTSGHVWRLDNVDLMNRVRWDYTELKEPEEPFVSVTEVESVDNLRVRRKELDPYDSDTVALLDPRDNVFRVDHSEIDPDTPAVRILSGYASGIGVPFSEVVDGHSEFLLQLYQDGPMHGFCEVGRELAESIEEGDYVVVDYDSLKGANPATEARTGDLLALVISLTRHPAHADLEYIVVRPATVVTVIEDPCPISEDEE